MKQRQEKKKKRAQKASKSATRFRKRGGNKPREDERWDTEEEPPESRSEKGEVNGKSSSKSLKSLEHRSKSSWESLLLQLQNLGGKIICFRFCSNSLQSLIFTVVSGNVTQTGNKLCVRKEPSCPT